MFLNNANKIAPPAMKGPNGRCMFLVVFLVQIKIIPKMDAVIEPTRIENQMPSRPVKLPIIAKRSISPAPIPSFFVTIKKSFLNFFLR